MKPWFRLVCTGAQRQHSAAPSGGAAEGRGLWQHGSAGEHRRVPRRHVPGSRRAAAPIRPGLPLSDRRRPAATVQARSLLPPFPQLLQVSCTFQVSCTIHWAINAWHSQYSMLQHGFHSGKLLAVTTHAISSCIVLEEKIVHGL